MHKDPVRAGKFVSPNFVSADFSKRFLTLLWVGCLCLATLPAFGTARNWTGGGGTGFWSTTANWSPAGAPANGDDLTFPGGLGATVTNNLSNLHLSSISF